MEKQTGWRGCRGRFLPNEPIRLARPLDAGRTEVRAPMKITKRTQPPYGSQISEFEISDWEPVGGHTPSLQRNAVSIFVSFECIRGSNGGFTKRTHSVSLCSSCLRGSSKGNYETNPSGLDRKFQDLRLSGGRQSQTTATRAVT